MNPESPTRVRRSSILKAPRSAASRSPLQCLEANQTAIDNLQDEDRTTVTRTTFKRRVSFSRTNRVQEFCLENPQAPTHHIWGPAYEKELSPEPSPLISRDIFCPSNPVDPSSSFQSLLSSEIKTSAVSTFSCSSRDEAFKSAFTQQSTFDYRSSSSAHYEPLWSQQQPQPPPQPQQQVVDDDDDMDITGQNPVPPALPSSLALDKENLQKSDRSDFLSRILTNVSTLNKSSATSTLGMNPTISTTSNMNASTLVDIKASFPNVRFESEEEVETSPKQSSVQNMLNQTCINDSSMDMSMSTCSVVGDQSLSELSDLELENATEGNKSLLDKSLKFLEKATGANDMDITQHPHAKENISGAAPSAGISRNVGSSNLLSFLNSSEYAMNKSSLIPSNQEFPKSHQAVSNASCQMDVTMDKSFKGNSIHATHEQSLLGFSASELATSDSTSHTKPQGSMDSTKIALNTTKLNPSFMNLTQTSSLLNASKSFGSQTMDFTQLEKSRVNPSFNSTRSADSQSMDITRLDRTQTHPFSFLSKTCGSQSMDLTQSVKPDCNLLDTSKSFGSQTMDFTQLEKSRVNPSINLATSSQSMDLTRLETTQANSFLFPSENCGSQTMNLTQQENKVHSSQSFVCNDLDITCKSPELGSLQNRKKLDEQVDMDFTKIDSPNDDTLSLLNESFGIPATDNDAGSKYWLGGKRELQHDPIEQGATSVLTSHGTQEKTDMDTTMEIEDEPINFMSSTLNKSTAPRSLLVSQELEVIKPIATQPQIEDKNDLNITNDMDITSEPKKLDSPTHGLLFTPPKSPVVENFQMPGNVNEMDITKTADEPSTLSPTDTKESAEENATSEAHDMDITRLPKLNEIENITISKIVSPDVSSPNITTKPAETPCQNSNVSMDRTQSNLNVVDFTTACHEVVSSDCSSSIVNEKSHLVNKGLENVQSTEAESPQSDATESPVSVLETDNYMDITAPADTVSEFEHLLSPTEDKDANLLNPVQYSIKLSEMDITKAGDLLPVKALSKTTCLESSDIGEHLCHTPSPASQEIISDSHLTESPDTEIIQVKPESTRVSTESTNETSVLQSTKINANGVTENTILCTENKDTKFAEICSSESNKTIMVEKFTVDDRIANEKCEIENCEISELVRTPSLSDSTEVEATRIHITEDFEDVQVNEQTGEISHQLKHFDFKETVESSPSEVFTPPLPSTKVDLNVSEELYLSPKQNRNSNITAAVIARQGNDSQQEFSDTKLLQPEFKAIGGEKRGSEWLEEEAVSNKKLCQKLLHVPEIIITAPTPPQIHSYDSPNPSTNQNPVEADMELASVSYEVDPKSETTKLFVPESDLVAQEPIPSTVEQNPCQQVTSIFSQEMCSSPEDMKLYSEETDLASQDMHLSSGEINLPSQEKDLVSQEMCSSPENTKLYSQETDLASQDMHLTSGEINLPFQETDLVSQEICSSHENMKLYSQETDLDPQDMHLLSEEMKLASTEVNLLSQETESSQEMEISPEVDDTVTSYPTKRKSDEPLTSVANKHFKYFEQAMLSFSGDFPNESLSLISEAIHKLNIPTQIKNEECLTPITLEDFIKELSQSARKTWRVLSLQSSHWKFSILHGTAVLSLKFSSDGNVTEAAFLPNSNVVEKLPRTHQAVWQFCLKQLEAKFPSSAILNHCMEAACVPDLLSKLAPTLNSLTSLGRGLVQATSFCVLKFYGNSVQFSLWSFKMRLLVKVKLDLSDWENLSTDHITINLVHGNVKTQDLRGLVNSVSRTWNLVPSFIQNLREYIQTLDDFCFTFPRALKHSRK